MLLYPQMADALLPTPEDPWEDLSSDLIFHEMRSLSTAISSQPEDTHLFI